MQFSTSVSSIVFLTLFELILDASLLSVRPGIELYRVVALCGLCVYIFV